MMVLDEQFLRCGNEGCGEILKRLPSPYFELGVCYYGCPRCNLVFKAKIENNAISALEKDERTYEKYMLEHPKNWE
ncbi:MAG: hypothetical protein HYY55_01565 [Candidatus Niyogibacteria bacterium]|nr:MAG: hypothetical protein HYY55_01565 [Candidatus Niyogibacteria bacterium]